MAFSNEKTRAPTAAQHKIAAVDLVLFDYGQVLSTAPDEKAWARMQSISRLSNDRLHEAYWALRHDYDRGTLTGKDYWREVAKHAGVSFDELQVVALLAADVDLWGQPNPPMVVWAARLQRASVRTAVLSNIGDAMAAGLTSRLAWLKEFERCIWSYSLKMAKPDPAIFRAAVEILRTTPNRILFIDDKEENVAAAQVMGMQAIRYTTQSGFEYAIHARGLSRLCGEQKDHH